MTTGSTLFPDQFAPWKPDKFYSHQHVQVISLQLVASFGLDAVHF